MKELTVYLAGDISRTNRWRPEVMRLFKDRPVRFVSPVDLIEYGRVDEENAENHVFHLCDYAKIDDADIVFAHIRKCESRHSGTSAEIGYAYAKRKLVIVVIELPEEEARLYEFIRRSATVSFKNLLAGMQFLREYVTEMQYDPRLYSTEKAKPRPLPVWYYGPPQPITDATLQTAREKIRERSLQNG